MKFTKLENQRKSLGITRRGLGRRIGYSEGMIYKVEARTAFPSLILLFKLCEALKLTPLEVAEDLGMNTKYLGRI